jgi:hypothetical protein
MPADRAAAEKGILTMTRHRCDHGSLDWCPLSGTRLYAQRPIARRYRVACRDRLRRRLFLLTLRLCQAPDSERCRQFARPACRRPDPVARDRRALP